MRKQVCVKSTHRLAQPFTFDNGSLAVGLHSDNHQLLWPDSSNQEEGAEAAHGDDHDDTAT
jgi:hypothetical protein